MMAAPLITNKQLNVPVGVHLLVKAIIVIQVVQESQQE